MEQTSKIYTIRIEGALTDRWKDWFGSLTVTNLENGQTLIEGPIQDQSVLVGAINQIHNLNLKLISVTCRDRDES